MATKKTNKTEEMKNNSNLKTLFAETEEMKQVETIIEKQNEVDKEKNIVKYPKIKAFNITSNSYINDNGKVVKAYTFSVFPTMTDDFFKTLLGRYQANEKCVVGGLNNGYGSKFDRPFYDHYFNGVRCLAMKPSYVCENYNDALEFWLAFAEALKLTEKQAVTFDDMMKLHAKAKREAENAKIEAQKAKREALKKDMKNRFGYLQFEVK